MFIIFQIHIKLMRQKMLRDGKVGIYYICSNIIYYSYNNHQYICTTDLNIALPLGHFLPDSIVALTTFVNIYIN